ncbi:uncharacterized protein LOC115286662 isoform X2 [Suricata suricatta]|uniref:Ribosomal protein L39 n=1 Tax=Suricata suricatta TaxID=37032 RepID=A0A673UPK0_SURSU|nr:uncharacterized protein LOC115286662 isoform X2 [Suricata suricatta]
MNDGCSCRGRLRQKPGVQVEASGAPPRLLVGPEGGPLEENAPAEASQVFGIVRGTSRPRAGSDRPEATELGVRALVPVPKVPDVCIGSAATPRGGTHVLRSRLIVAERKPRHSWLFLAMSSHKTFRIKRFLAKKQKQNRPIPQWIRMKTGNKIRYNSKRRHWRRAKLGL